MTTRSVIVLVVVTAALSGLFSFSVAAGGLHRGPAGPEGPAGPAGPPGSAEVTPEGVQQAVDDDPDAVAKSLSGHLDYDDIRTNLGLDDTVPAATSSTDGTATRDDLDELSGDLDDLRRKVEDLCSELSRTDAGADLTAC